MASGPSHYRDTETLMAQADQSAVAANLKAVETGDPMAALPGLLGAFITLIAANNHALLALAGAVAKDLQDHDEEWREVLGDGHGGTVPDAGAATA
jgi:hypothetical protein